MGFFFEKKRYQFGIFCSLCFLNVNEAFVNNYLKQFTQKILTFAQLKKN